MLELLRATFDGFAVVVIATDRGDGDVHPVSVDAEVLARRQVAATGRRWVMLDQVHGTDVYDAGAADDGAAGGEMPVVAGGDVLVSSCPEAVLAVWAADCAPIVLVGDRGTRVAVHAGWRGLAAGVLDVGIDRLEAAGESVEHAVLGPAVHSCCYEFGRADATRVAAGVGAPVDDVIDATSTAARLDVPAAIRAGLGRRGVALDVIGPCTGCDDRWFSHRVRGEVGRHAVVTWVESSCGG